MTADPHSYKTLRFEYPEFGAVSRVRHYTEVLADLLAAGRLPVRRRLEGVVTCHDPCYLSRYADVTEPPRRGWHSWRWRGTGRRPSAAGRAGGGSE